MFRNINRAEWQTLFDYLQNKRIKIENFQAAKQGPIGPGAGITIDEGEMDAGMRAAAAEAGEAGGLEAADVFCITWHFDL